VNLIKKLLFEDKLSIPEVKGIIDQELESSINTEQLLENHEQDDQQVSSSVEFALDNSEVALHGLGSIIASKDKLNDLYHYIESIEKKHCWA
jgi:hypothetical protein